MANWYEPSEEEQASYKAWAEERPDNVRALAEKFLPWKLYRLKSSGHRVVVHSFDEQEDGKITLRVDVSGKFNYVAIERRVVGIEPESLEECELPGPDEPLGTAGLSHEDAKDLLLFMSGNPIPTKADIKEELRKILRAKNGEEEPS